LRGWPNARSSQRRKGRSVHRFERFAGIVASARLARAATARLGFTLCRGFSGRRFIARRADCGRQQAGIEARSRSFLSLFVTTRTAVVAAGAQTTGAALFTSAPLFPVPAIAADKGILGRLIGIAARFLAAIILGAARFLVTVTLFAAGAIFAFAAGIDRLVEAGEIVVVAELAGILGFIALTFGAFLPALVTRAALLFLAQALIGDDAEIVVGELQVVFRLHPIAVHVRILRQLAILFEQLRGIATRPAIDPVKLLTTTATLTVAATAPTVIPTIIVQG
jgi:hypothetical protein